MPNNELQEILGARFEEHTHPTDEAVWSAIEARLDADTSNRKGIWFWIFNGLAATVLFGCMIHTSGSKEALTPKLALTSSKIQLNKEEATTDNETATSYHQEDSNASETIEGNSPSTSEIASLSTNESSSDQSGLGREKHLASDDSNGIFKTFTKTEHESNTIHLSYNPFDHAGSAKIAKHDRIEVPKEDDIAIGPLACLTLEKYMCPERAIYTHDFGSFTPKEYSIELPIHLGVEFSYLKRTGTDVNMWAAGIAQDTSNFTTTEQLANNRHIEISGFGQFHFTRRFSTSVGLGYSRSVSSFESLISNSTFASIPVTKKSELHLITVPIQTKFNFFTKNRFSLNGGVTLQGEFGRMTYSEEQTADASTSTVPLSEESLVVGKIHFQQFALEPYLQLSIQVSPRISVFTNAGYRMYLLQTNIPGTLQNRLNYFNADAGLLFRLR